MRDVITVVWLLYGLIAVLAVFIVVLLFLLAGVHKRLSRIEHSASNPCSRGEDTASVTAITQSRAFTDVVRQMIHAHMEHFHASSKKAPSADSVAVVEPPSSLLFSSVDQGLTETETSLLSDLMSGAKYGGENVFDNGYSGGARDTVCTRFLSEINQQYERNYSNKDCEALARKLVLLVLDHPDPLLAAGRFMRVRYIRENVAIDFDTRVIETLKTFFGKDCLLGKE